MVPLTFVIDLESDSIEADLQFFAEIFKSLQAATNSMPAKGQPPPASHANGGVPPTGGPRASTQLEIHSVPARFLDSKYKYTLRGPFNFEGQRHYHGNANGIVQAAQEFATFHRGQSLWLLKPAEYNRGRGIQLFNDLLTLKKLVNEQYALIADEKNQNNMIDSLYKKSYHLANNSTRKG
jgi:hypothetical protein